MSTSARSSACEDRMRFCASASCTFHRVGGIDMQTMQGKGTATFESVYFFSDKRVCAPCHQRVTGLHNGAPMRIPSDLRLAQRAAIEGMEYFLESILPYLSGGASMDGLLWRTQRMLVDKTLTYVAEGLAADAKVEPWCNNPSFESTAAAACRRLVAALNLASSGAPPRHEQVLRMFGTKRAGQPWRAEAALYSWLIQLRRDNDVLAACDAYYLDWQIWISETHGPDALASTACTAARRRRGSRNVDAVAAAPARCRVLLHVYELGKGTRLAETIKGLNSFTQSTLGAGGVFHAAVEVVGVGGGLEWSFGYAPKGTGVFAVRATEHPDHAYRQTVELGETPISRPELGSLIRTMQDVWAGESYQLVRCNCISFCKALATALNVGGIPDWVDRFPRIGAASLEVSERINAAAAAAGDAISKVMLPAAPLGSKPSRGCLPVPTLGGADPLAKPPPPTRPTMLRTASADHGNAFGGGFERVAGSFNRVWSPNSKPSAVGGRSRSWTEGSVREVGSVRSLAID